MWAKLEDATIPGPYPPRIAQPALPYSPEQLGIYMAGQRSVFLWLLANANAFDAPKPAPEGAA